MKKSWEDIFFCVPWTCDRNDYTFSFIDTLNLQSTQFYAMRMKDRYHYKFDPICDSYDELQQITNDSSNYIQINLLKNDKHKMIAVVVP